MSVGAPSAAQTSLSPALQRAYVRLIEERAGIKLTLRQIPALEAAVGELVPAEQIGTPEALRAASEDSSKGLLEDLAARLTVPETHFFRIKPQIEALRDMVLPKLVEQNAGRRGLNIWSAGCSTGEEPYTLAILLEEVLDNLSSWSVRLLATDISGAALDTARAARYRDWSFRDTPHEIRSRYFLREGQYWRLRESTRRRVEFVRHNLAAETVPAAIGDQSGFDLILCRNVTIYFDRDATERLYLRLTQALGPRGWLVLGPCDPPPPEKGLLEPVYLDGAVLWRRVSEPHSSGRSGFKRAVASAPRSDGASRSELSHRSSREEEVVVITGPAVDTERPKADEAATEKPSSQAEPLKAVAHLTLGIDCLEQGDAAGAADALRRAAYLDSEDPFMQFNLGRAYLQLGVVTRGRSALLQARRILAVLADADPITSAPGLTAGELRRAVAMQLDALSSRRQGVGSA